MMFLERTRDGHHQSEIKNKQTNSIKGYVGETSERRGGTYMNFLEGIDTISR